MILYFLGLIFGPRGLSLSNCIESLQVASQPGVRFSETKVPEGLGVILVQRSLCVWTSEWELRWRMRTRMGCERSNYLCSRWLWVYKAFRSFFGACCNSRHNTGALLTSQRVDTLEFREELEDQPKSWLRDVEQIFRFLQIGEEAAVDTDLPGLKGQLRNGRHRRCPSTVRGRISRTYSSAGGLTIGVLGTFSDGYSPSGSK